MTSQLMARVHAALERRFPERRLFLKSEDHTRFIRLKPEIQLIAWSGSAVLVGWTVVATAILLMDTIGSGNYREQAERDKTTYEDRLDALSEERDSRAAETIAAQARFAAALDRISAMQSQLLASEGIRRERETGLSAVQATLRRAMDEREAAREQLAALTAETEDDGRVDPVEMAGSLDIVTKALSETAAERDAAAASAEQAVQLAGDLDLDMRLMEEQNDAIFRQIEDALQVSVEPLDGMFRTVGLDADRLIDQVREGYSGMGGPLTPIQFSTMGTGDDGTARANGILDELDRLNLYRIAAAQVPFANPLRDAYRLTSDFGPRQGRMHEGLDMAGPLGTPVYASADGVVIQAGWAGDYGNFIKIQHEFGIETRFAHLSAVRVQVGQRVSRGDWIGDMGSTGRSTGSHLHYEIRVGGEPSNPRIYIGAGNDVL